MTFNSAFDVVVILYSLLAAVVYVLGDGYFAIPGGVLALALAWSAIGWRGWSSVHVMLSVLGMFALGALLRRSSHKRIYVRTTADPAKSVLTSVGLFALVLIPVIVISAAQK